MPTRTWWSAFTGWWDVDAKKKIISYVGRHLVFSATLACIYFYKYEDILDIVWSYLKRIFVVWLLVPCIPFPSTSTANDSYYLYISFFSMSWEDSSTALHCLVLSHGHHSLSHPWDPSLCQLQCPASCWVLEWSLGQWGFFLILLPALFAWEAKFARKENCCLLLPPNQSLLSYWHDAVLLRKNSLLFFGFFFYGFKKKIENKNPSFFLNPCSLLWWLKWVGWL